MILRPPRVALSLSLAILGWTAAALGLGATAFAAYVGAAALFPTPTGTPRLAATIALWLLGTQLWILGCGALGVLSAWPTLATAALLGGLAGMACRRRRTLVEAARGDVEQIKRRFDAALRSPWSLALLPVAFVGLVRAARPLVSPPMGTDALTYHLVRAARFAQTGSFAIEPGPDAWGYVAYYPPSGDALWALALSLGRGLGLGDALLGPLDALVWLGVVVTTYATARTWGLAPRRAALSAAAVGATPAVLGFLGACYVDSTVLLSVLLALALLPRGRAGLGLGMASLGLAAALKATGLPVLGLGSLYAVALAWRQPGSAKWLIGGTLVAIALVIPNYLAGWLDHQNPLYPFAIELGPLQLAGNVQNVALHRGAYAPAEVLQFSALRFAEALTWPRWGSGIQHLNFGPMAWPLVGLAGVGLARAIAGGERRREALLVLGLVVVFTVRLTGPDSLAHRTFLAPAVGRLLLVPMAGLWLFAATVAPRPRLRAPVVDGALALAAVVGAYLAFPRGIAGIELGPNLVAAAVLAGAGALWLGLLRATPPLTPRLRATGIITALALLLGLAVSTAWVRPELRYDVWRAGTDASAFDPHPTDPKVMTAAGLWEVVDQTQPHRIAYAAGFDGMGHNWYRYPLFGRRLQNEALYVPITVDGAAVDYRDPNRALARGDEVAWLTRLRDKKITFLFIGAPPRCPEFLWARARPEVFELAGRAGDNWLFRIRPQPLHDLLSAPVGRQGPPPRTTSPEPAG